MTTFADIVSSGFKKPVDGGTLPVDSKQSCILLRVTKDGLKPVVRAYCKEQGVGILSLISDLSGRILEANKIFAIDDEKLEKGEFKLVSGVGLGEAAYNLAVCDYEISNSDIGMAYRSQIGLIRTLTKSWRINQNSTKDVSETNRPQLIEECASALDTIYGSVSLGEELGAWQEVKIRNLYEYAWFDPFVLPEAPTNKIAKRYAETTSETANSNGANDTGNWQTHHDVSDPAIQWVLLTLYCNLTWAAQYPSFRSWDYLNRAKNSGALLKVAPKSREDVLKIEGYTVTGGHVLIDKKEYTTSKYTYKYMEKGKLVEKDVLAPEELVKVVARRDFFLDGLNVSGLLLDKTLTPRAWSFNTNRVNKTHHAETALVLAWMRGQKEEKDYGGWWFMSPWRSCCMCSSWIAEKLPGCKVLWFVNDPGLPVRQLDNEATNMVTTTPTSARLKGSGCLEVYLPRILAELKEKCAEIKALWEWLSWISYFGHLTHEVGDRKIALDKGLAEIIKNTKTYESPTATFLLYPEDKTIGDGLKLVKPVDLFGTETYFNCLSQAWDQSRFLPTSVLRCLADKFELNAYVNNVLYLRRCIMEFEEEPQVVHHK